jgi:Zn-dependent peptidase ImmA (M78 family)
VGRRNFDLAHELFHILTWDAMPPEHTEEARETGGNRVEQLANNFASAVLMPTRALERFGDWFAVGERELPARLNAVAEELQVTASALKWRLVALDQLKPAVARSIPETALRNNGRETVASTPPPLFSKPFIEVIALATEEGRVSARRAAGLLDLTVDDLADLFTVHGVQSPVEL